VNELRERDILKAERNLFTVRLLLILAGYVGTTLLLNAIRVSAALWILWPLVVVQIFLYLSIFVICSFRLKKCGYRLSWLFYILFVLSRVNDWELIIIPALVVTVFVLSARNQDKSWK
jgi:hypothetical protein